MKKLMFKATDKDLRSCKYYRFEIGKEHATTGKIEACKNGFHACENPLDVLMYYPLIGSRFFVVKQRGAKDIEENKTASEKIVLEKELDLKSFIEYAVIHARKYANTGYAAVLADSNDGSKIAVAGSHAQIAASGDSTQIVASGESTWLAAAGTGSKLVAFRGNSALASSGYNSKLMSSGDESRLAASGNNSEIAALGFRTGIVSSGSSSTLKSFGDKSEIAATGFRSILVASGGLSRLVASGDNARITASGCNSVVAAVGQDSMVSGCNGTLICLTHYVGGLPVKFVTGKIGEKGLKENVSYGLDRKGRFVEV